MAGAKLPGFDEHVADIGGTRLRCFVAGEGPPVLLVHGLGGAAVNWVEIAPALARRRRVLCPDLPGHGGSAPLSSPLSLAAYADCVALLAEREGMLPAPVVGHSLGGVVALWMAIRRSESVRGIVLAGAATMGMRTPRARLLITVIGLLRPARAVAPLRGLVARTPWLRYPVFGGWGASDPPAMPPAAVEAFLAPHGLHTDTRSAGRALLHDEAPDLDRVRCPCLVLWGARDRLTTLESGFAYARRLGAPLRAIADCGHLLIGERPDACLDAIEGFLEAVEGPPRIPIRRTSTA